MNDTSTVAAASETGTESVDRVQPGHEPGATAEGHGIGTEWRRVEDLRLITGRGRFVGDLRKPGDCEALILRSSYAHAKIVRIDTRAATQCDGVLAVLTGEDIVQAGLGGIPWEVCPPPLQHLSTGQGDPAIAPPQPLLAVDRVRYVGEPVAVIIASSLAAANEAAELIELDVEELPAMTSAKAAVTDGSPLVWDRFPANTLFEHRIGEHDGVDTAFSAADQTVTLATHIPRLNAAPIEPRCYRGSIESATGRYILEASAGKPHPVRDTLARHVFGIEPDRIHMIAPDIGGGFGAKNVAHAEAALVLFGARLVGMPVNWTGTRSDSFQSDMQGRDHHIVASLAFDDNGRFRALRYRTTVNLGAYLGPRAVIPCLSGSKSLTGAYAIPAAVSDIRAVFTNTVPTCPYRGAGAPETAFVVERLVDMAARKLEMDPAAIRALNLVTPAQQPYRTPSGTTIHSTDFPSILETARAKSGWDDGRSRQKILENGRLRGIGLAFAVEAYGTSFDEAATIAVSAEGPITIAIGTKSSGQSHETAYAQVAASVLGLPADRFQCIQGDTDTVHRGNGTGASRSMTTGGSAVFRACEALIAMARPIAAEMLQCQPDALTFGNGEFRVEKGATGESGAAPTVGLHSIAARTGNGRLEVEATFRPELFNVPGGCHVAEVEVDPETGVVAVTRYVVVHDCGQAINPMVVRGQLAGGIAQGLGAALGEQMVFDADSAQVLTGSFMDYAMPRASDVPSFEIHLPGIACASNPLGAKAVGEAGTVAAPPAIINAVVDALSSYGIDHIDLPATPNNVWQAIANRGAYRGA